MDDGVTDGPYRTKREALAEHASPAYPHIPVCYRYGTWELGEYTVGYDIEDCWTVNVVTGERAISEGYFHEDNEEEDRIMSDHDEITEYLARANASVRAHQNLRDVLTTALYSYRVDIVEAREGVAQPRTRVEQALQNLIDVVERELDDNRRTAAFD